MSHFKKNAPAVEPAAGALGVFGFGAISHVKLRYGVESGLAAHVDAAVFHSAPERAAAAGGLIGGELFAAQGLEPVRHDVAVAGAADGVLGHAELGRKAAGDAVELASSARGVLQ